MSKEIKDKNIKLLKSIGGKLRSKRKELKISQGKIADLLDISDTQIYKYELGYSLIPLDNLLKLCELFNVDIYYFLGDIKKEKQENASVINYPINSELEKRVMMLKEIYEFNYEDLNFGVNNCIDSMYAILKKRQKQGRDRETPKKKKNANN
jgi:transcriptional regulator with XRE-family HTH domain